MKKYIGYIPAALLTIFYLTAGLTGASITMSMALFWLACFWIAAFLLHKGLAWGGILGLIPGLHMILIGDSDLIFGIAVVLFYMILGIFLWKKKESRK